MFKDFIISVALAVSMAFLAVPAQAADVFSVNRLNVQGDILYLPSSGQFAVGIGTTIATIYDIAEVRGVFVDPLPDETDNKAGLGIGVNLVKLINKVGGIWLLNDVNPSIGIIALTNLSGKAHLEPAIYVSAVNWKF